jgi:acyl-CoA thioesterase-2
MAPPRRLVTRNHTITAAGAITMNNQEIDSVALPEATAWADDLLAVTRQPTRDDVWSGAPRDYGPLRIYGGHFLGQALAAAFRSMPEGKLAHSLHAYFVRAGLPDQPIDYHVERLRDGGYVTRAVRALQAGETRFVMTASFKEPETGDTHQPDAPAVPDATAAQRVRETAGRGRIPLPFTLGTGVELEILDDWSPQNPRLDSSGIQLWMRLPVRAHDDLRLQQCALAFLSDSTLLFNALRRHGQPFATHRTTSLDHALWFHGVPRCDHWLVYAQHGPAAADGRGINLGFVYATDGRLLATAAQEGMMRRV